MVITITFGLTFGTILTMIAVPVLYATLGRLQPAEQSVEPGADNETAGQPA